jgi:large subunit ribosomal protein L28e
LSKDPRNLANVHNYKFSGVAQARSVGITQKVTETKGEKKVSIQLSAPASAVNKPKSASTTTAIPQIRKKGFAAVEAAVAAVRPDLRSTALIRYSQLVKATGAQGKAGKGAGRAERRRKY